MNRIDNYERMYLGENLEMPEAASRIDVLWKAILNKSGLPFEPVTRVEKYLAKMIDSSIETPEPKTRLEEILNAICNGEKVDEGTKNACKDEYLKYIYEQASGENMFVPTSAVPYKHIKYDGRTITINGGNTSAYWVAQIYDKLPISVNDTVTIRYRYKSGAMNGGGNAVLLAPSSQESGHTVGWATNYQLCITQENYNEDQIVVATVNTIPKSFTIYTAEHATFDNLTFEVSFEKGDTTK